MCHSRNYGSCVSCHHKINRRGFIKSCGLTLVTANRVVSRISQADEPKNKPVRVGLVFLSKPDVSWPYPEFDVEAREKEILNLLREGCSGVEFVPAAIRSPSDVKKVISMKDQVDGYLIYVVTLTRQLTEAITTIGKVGRPMIVADEYLGGSGVFLVGYSRLCQQGILACAVATTRMGDLVAVAQCFRDLKPNTTPEAFAERCKEVYRKDFRPRQ